MTCDPATERAPPARCDPPQPSAGGGGAATRRPDFWDIYDLVAPEDRSKYARLSPQHTLGCIYTAFGLATFGEQAGDTYLRVDAAGCHFIPLDAFDGIASPHFAATERIEFRLYHRQRPGAARCDTTSRATLLTVRAVLYGDLESIEAMKATLAKLSAEHMPALRQALKQRAARAPLRKRARYAEDDEDDEDGVDGGGRAHVRVDLVELLPAVGITRMDATSFDGPVGPHLVELFGAIDARPMGAFRKRMPRIRAPTFSGGAANPFATPPTSDTADEDNAVLGFLAEEHPRLLEAYREMHRLEVAIATALDRVATLVADNVRLALGTASPIAVALDELSAEQAREIGAQFLARTRRAARAPSPTLDAADADDEDGDASRSSGTEYLPSEASDDETSDDDESDGERGAEHTDERDSSSEDDEPASE